MSLMEHLEELRKRIVHSAIYLALGFGAYRVEATPTTAFTPGSSSVNVR